VLPANINPSVASGVLAARSETPATAVTKDMLNREASMSLESALIAEARVQATRMEDPNFREAHRAFTEKRPPRFE
jgi:enoyl-CoA hydratase/carnithine racemase